MDFGRPRVDWPALAESFGVSGVRVADADELAERLATSTADQPPQLIEVPIEPFGSEG